MRTTSLKLKKSYRHLTLVLGGIFLLHTPAAFAASSTAATTPPAQNEAQSEQQLKAAQAFADSLITTALGFLDDESLSKEQKRESFRKLLLERFDMKTLARFSMGRYWRQATTAQKKEYYKLFQDMVVEVYSQRFDEYNGQPIEVRRAHPEGRSDIVVSSFIIQEDKTEVQVDWRVRAKDGKFRVVDVVVEGVSMALTQRSDFASVIQRGGGKVEVLIAHLRPQEETAN